MPAPYRFALISHSVAIVEDVAQCAPQGDYTFDCQVTLHADLLRVARARLAEGYDVLLCHGGTGYSIMQHIGHSVVEIDRTDMDVIKSLREARKHANRIILALFAEEYHDISVMEELLGIQIHCLVYHTWDEMFYKIEQAYAEGLRVLVGGGVSTRKMIELGGVGLVVRANPRSIKKAFTQALLIARQKRLEAMRHADFVAVFKYIPQGVLCVDNAGNVVFSNQQARALLKVSSNATHEELAPFYDALLLTHVLCGNAPMHNTIREIQGVSFVINAFPLRVHSEEQGAVSIFHDVPSLQHINRKITDNLYAKGFVSTHGIEAIKGESPCIIALKHLVKRFAPAKAIVLISGETGTGKELVAHALHTESHRHTKPFLAINCGALSEHLIESELFGYEDGAFTGAKKGGKTGLFEMAEGGTIFLDEIAEISHAMQLRLLRVLETRQIMRVGGSRIITVDTRIVCASHKNLMELVHTGLFRHDLYYRISTLPVCMPPLRERLEDIPVIIKHAAPQYALPVHSISPSMIAHMQKYHWPGNIRELLAFIEKFSVLRNNDAHDDALFMQLLQENRQSLVQCVGSTSHFPLQAHTKSTRRAAAQEVLARCHGNKKETARQLGISISTLWRVLREFCDEDSKI